ncbi:DUF998 domain-containing protein [Mycoplasma sp. P36-A1]|uniref:DUF998 domain-containing protein n=1 Tax=Mycoplasma sp. P36-A1 TaxID=3252900 RepID=UPI003C2C5979
MEKTDEVIVISEKLNDFIKANNDLDYEVMVKEDEFIIKPFIKTSDNMIISLRWFLIPSVISTLIYLGLLLYLNVSKVPVSGDYSLASAIIVFGVISAMSSFVYFYIKSRRQVHSVLATSLYWRNFFTIVISVGIILTFVLLGLFWMVELMFVGVSFDIYSSCFIFFMFLCITNYTMIYLALSISPKLIINLFTVFIIGGVIMSMVENGHLQWWQHNFSFLGTQNASNSWQFNLTLLISSLLMMSLIDYLFVLLRKKDVINKRLTALKVLLFVTAINLGAIGLFPNNGKGNLHHLHDLVAQMLIVFTLVLILGIKYFIPKISNEFLVYSYGSAIVLVIVTFLYKGIHYLNLTAFEFICFIMAFAWLILLFQSLQKMVNDNKEIIIKKSIKSKTE